jgi:hypothetical protein
MAMERRTFHGPDIDIPALAQALADKFSHDGYETQTLQTPNGLTVQIRKEEMLRKIAGMSSALTVVMAMEGEYVAVEIGGAKWADKGVAAGVGAIIFFPALITAGIGAFQQSQLNNHAWQFIEQYIRSNSSFGGSSFGPGQFAMPPQPAQFSSPAHAPAPIHPGQAPAAFRGPAAPTPLNMGAAPAAGPAGNACTQCGQVLPAGSKFCLACGAPASRVCFSCGQQLQPAARFCNSCGSPVSH